MVDISVIIPNYNRANLIGETISNILAQTYQSCELIVVDDGSTDESLSVIKKFGDKVILLSQANLGPGAARNAGFKISRGRFIQFFDSDDLMTVNKLEVQAALLKKDAQIDLAYGPYVMAMQDAGDWKQLDVIMQYFPLPERPLSYVVAEGWCAITQSCLFRREAVERAGLWREDLMPHEDKEYWYRLGKAVQHSIHENESCVFYRQHKQQITDLDVRELDRTRDGVNALNLIIEQMKLDHAPLISRILCNGIRAGYVRYLRDKGQSDFEYAITDEFFFNLYRVRQKIGRMKTRTNWQPFHGPLNDGHKFQEYLALLNY